MDRCAARGFSLVELFLIISLLALVAGIAVPSFSNFISRHQALALADQLQSQLMLARTISINNNRDVEICGSADGENCDGHWDGGWILYIVDAESPLARQVLNRHEHLRWKGFSKIIRFRSNGTAPMGNGTFYICDSEEKVVLWQLTINRQGRVRRQPGANAGCS